jgi:hypothetical protein
MDHTHHHVKHPLQTLHAKDTGEYSTRHFNTQIGELFHDGMGLREPKTAWNVPKHSGEPHKSIDEFSRKKIKHLAMHHAVSGKPTYSPIQTDSRVLEPGRFANIDKTNSRPVSSPARVEKFRSQQELILLKRRHMTDLDGKQGLNGTLSARRPLRSSRTPRSPKSPSEAGSQYYQSGFDTGGGYRTNPSDLPPAGMESKGARCIRDLGPRDSTIPHQSLTELNLKKQQHLVRLHNSSKDVVKDARFR